MKETNLSVFGLLLLGIFFANCGNDTGENADSTYYPTASRYAKVLYAMDVKSKEGNIKNYAAYFVVNGPGEFVWEENLADDGEYEVVLGYSVRARGATASITTGNGTLSDSLDITEGVYEENKDWYQFNCVRKLLDGSLNLSKGLNSINLRINVPDSAFESIIYSLELIPLGKKPDAVKEITEARKSRPEMNWFVR